MTDIEVPLAGGGRSIVSRRDDIVFRSAGFWSPQTIRLLRHLEERGYEHAPRVVGSGFDVQGRETLSFIEGDFIHPGPWSTEALYRIGVMLRSLHEQTADFDPGEDVLWRPWFGRRLGGVNRVVGHCDTGPWNIVAQDGLPVALIDWEEAGPVDRDVELAQACWLNAQLHDDDVAERVGLDSPQARARHMRTLLDGYGLDRVGRESLVWTMVEFAIHAAADQAVQARVTIDKKDGEAIWGIAWRARAASWMLRHRTILQQALA